MKKVISFFCVILMMISITGCSKNNAAEYGSEDGIVVKKEKYLDIMTTDKNLYNIVKQIVGDKHYVDYMFNNRKSLIDFKFSKDSLDNISKKDLFFYVGVDFEPWIDSFLNGLNKNKVAVVNSSRGVRTIAYDRKVKYNDKVLKNNPYYFLNLNNYKIVLSNIKNSIQDKDPGNRGFYEKNFSEILKDVSEYDDKFKKIGSDLKKYNFIIDEDNLDYFLDYLGLNVTKIIRDDKGKITNSTDINNLLNSSNKKIVFLYTEDKQYKNNKKLIDDNKLKSSKLKVYNSNITYKDIMKYNLDILNNIIKK